MKIKINPDELDLSAEDFEFEEKIFKKKSKKIKDNLPGRDIYKKNRNKDAKTSEFDRSESE